VKGESVDIENPVSSTLVRNDVAIPALAPAVASTQQVQRVIFFSFIDVFIFILCNSHYCSSSLVILVNNSEYVIVT
jgi:hypothetical protein